MRIVKEHDERKTELLDAAEKLFFELGYEQTPVSAIIDKVGVSKGTFYYYFKSKEDLLDCIAERAAHQSMQQVQVVVDEERLDALSKLNKVYEVSRSWQASNVELVMTILKVMYMDENLLLRHKIQQRSLELCIPIYSKIIEQGLREGTFDVSDPKEVAEMIIRIGNNLGDTTTVLFLDEENMPGNLQIIERKIALYEEAVERILGASKGSVQVLDKEFLRAFAEQCYARQGKKMEHQAV